jgi:DNA uptake protein ComE-like DNA-binding protein
MDRIIRPDGNRMLNINTASAQELYNVLQGIINLDPNLAAQLAVNIVDLRDDNNDVTSFDPDPPGGQIYYGFERPCIYISELDYNQVTIMTGSPPTPTIHTSYAVELYKPYSEDSVPGSGFWRITVNGAPINIDSWPAGKSFYVVQKQDPSARIPVDTNAVVKDYPLLVFAANSRIELQRSVIDPNGKPKYITVDSNQVPAWLVSGDGLRSYQRDISKHKCIRRLWDSAAKTPTLGSPNSYVDNSRPELVQARPANKPFTNIGEIGMIFRNSAYNVLVGVKEADIRLNLAGTDSYLQQIFNYLTVFDPAVYTWNDPNETRVKGRVNINTAPWFVIAQLPWVSQKRNQATNYALANAIVAYRDKTSIPGVDYSSRSGQPGFRSTGELMNVSTVPPSGDPNYSIYYYGLDDGIDQMGFPDLTTDPRTGVDGAPNDFEERDVIFARISNLISVRSDVFTAYILIRIGPNGPQRRVVAILDRSKVTPTTDKVKIIALQPVPDPR